MGNEVLEIGTVVGFDFTGGYKVGKVMGYSPEDDDPYLVHFKDGQIENAPIVLKREEMIVRGKFASESYVKLIIKGSSDTLVRIDDVKEKIYRVTGEKFSDWVDEDDLEMLFENQDDLDALVKDYRLVLDYRKHIEGKATQVEKELDALHKESWKLGATIKSQESTLLALLRGNSDVSLEEEE